MKTGNKIAFFYTAMTVGIIALVTVAFYFIATNYISRLYYSYLTEKAYATAEKHWEKDEVDEESYARIQKRYEETLPVATEILLNADSVAETHVTLVRYMTEKEIERLYKGEVITFHEKEKVGAALYYPDNEGNFIVPCYLQQPVWRRYPAAYRLVAAGFDCYKCGTDLFCRKALCNPHGRPYRCCLSK